jgi:transcriptional regulator with XRE-family HTH domain
VSRTQWSAAPQTKPARFARRSSPRASRADQARALRAQIKVVAAMTTVEPEVDRFLTLLRNKIRERGFTQLDVQQALGWGRSYISQLLTRQKALRVEQVLLILDVIGIEPVEFFQELYATPFYAGAPKDAEEEARLRRQLDSLRSLVHGLADLLLAAKVISPEDLSRAVDAAGERPAVGD